MTETIWWAVHCTRKLVPAFAAFSVTAAACVAHAGEVPTDSVEIGEAKLSVERAPDASECPGAETLASELATLGIDATTAAPVAIHVALEPDATGFAALVTVGGENGGVRALRADGPGCTRLKADLEATLALLLDRTQRSNAPSAPVPTVKKPVPPPPVAPPPSAKPPAVSTPARTPSAWHGRVEAGAGLAVALVAHPAPYFDAAFWVEHPDFSAAFELFSTTSSSAELAPGSVHVLLYGGVLKGCVPLFGSLRRVQGSLCVAGSVAVLHGRAEDYAVTKDSASRPWYALGGAAVLGGPITQKLGWKADATLLLPLHHESFVVGPLGTAFETPVVGALLGFRLGWSIW